MAHIQPLLAQHPLGFGQWLTALSYALSQPREIAIVGDLDAKDTDELLAVAQDGYRPFQVVALGAPDAQPAAVPLLQDRGLVDGRATAYVCRSFSCRTPATDVDALRVLLENG